MSDWTPAKFAIRGPNILDAEVEGISDGTFGIDRRRRIDWGGGKEGVAHAITHLKTGYLARAVGGGIANAKKVVAILHEADWDFDNPEEAKSEPRKAAAIKANATGLCISFDEVVRLTSEVSA